MQPVMTRKQKLLIGIVVSTLVVLLGITLLSGIGKVKVAVVVTPREAKLTIDGRSAKPGKIGLSKGKHTLKASLEGFTDAVRVIDTATYDAKRTIYLQPSPASDAARKWLEDNPEAQEEREAAGGAEAEAAQDDIADIAVLKSLPFIAPGFEFTVDYDTKAGTDGRQKVTIYVKADTDAAKQHAREWIKAQGSDPKTLTIVYEPLDMPADDPNVGHQ